MALGIGYVAGDLTDVVPGVLTLQPMRIPTVPSARTARAAASVLVDADRSIPVDAAAADALIDTFLGSEGPPELTLEFCRDRLVPAAAQMVRDSNHEAMERVRNAVHFHQ